MHRGYLSLYTSADEGSELSKQSARMQVRVLTFFLDKYVRIHPQFSTVVNWLNRY